MSGERKLWSPEEDAILKELRDKGIKKWCIISKIMHDQYNISGRSGKQCRQRWFNRLDPKIKDAKWNQKENAKLFKLHDQLGNSWVKISKQFKGRTDNSIKNHFYSILRKAVRKINKFISNSFNSGNQVLPLGSGLVSKIVSGADDKFDKKVFLPSSITQNAHTLKNKLVPFADDKVEQWGSTQEIIQVINSLNGYQKDYDMHLNSCRDQKCKGQSLIPQKQSKKQVNDQQGQEEAFDFIQKREQYTKTDLLKQSGSFDVDYGNLHELNRLSSGSFFKPRGSMNISESGDSEVFFKKLSNYSNMSGLNGSSIFPRLSSISGEWEKEIFISSNVNLHGPFGDMLQKSQFLIQRLDQK